MNSFQEFIKELISIIKTEKIESINIKEQQLLLSKINEFLYTNYDGIGTTIALEEEFEYFSEFHKYWEKYHEKLLNPQINVEKCEQVANVLHQIYLDYGDAPFKELYDTQGLDDPDICRVRFLTANQDFRVSRDFEKAANIFTDDKTIFELKTIAENPELFVTNLKLGSLSQSDKRIRYAEKIANYLLEKKIEPYGLLDFFSGDYAQLRRSLIELKGAGYGQKKTDMFLRDMRILGVWGKGKNFHTIDVASDINTIRVALRTGILHTDILLLSSFLDIFCYQYGIIDYFTAKAWRKVWEIWYEKYPDEKIESPSQMDYLIYRLIGKELCKERLCLFKCEVYGHEFYWHSGRNQTCQLCFDGVKERNKAKLIKKDLPCKYDEGRLYVEKNKIRRKILPNITECPFVSVCKPRSIEFKKLNPPRSISILGRTGWDDARTRKDEGGGGLMA